MLSEPLRIIAEANAEIAGFLDRALAEGLGPGDPGKVLSAIEPQLPAIAATLGKAGAALASSVRGETRDRESRLQIDLYTQNLQRLRELLPPLLASAELQHRRLATGADEVRETTAWFRALQSTEMD